MGVASTTLVLKKKFILPSWIKYLSVSQQFNFYSNKKYSDLIGSDHNFVLSQRLSFKNHNSIELSHYSFLQITKRTKKFNFTLKFSLHNFTKNIQHKRTTIKRRPIWIMTLWTHVYFQVFLPIDIWWVF